MRFAFVRPGPGPPWSLAAVWPGMGGIPVWPVIFSRIVEVWKDEGIDKEEYGYEKETEKITG